MGFYENNNGVLSPISGRGKAEYGASTVRTGTVTIPDDTTAGSFRVAFSDAMPDSNYIVNWYFDDCADGDAGRLVGAINCDANGFWLYYFGGFTKDVIIKYTAFKLYTDVEYNGLLSTVDEINERISQHERGTVVNISAYNSSSNCYVCPSDGYVRVSDDKDAINFKSGTTLISSNGECDISVFVRKDTEIYATNSGGTDASSARFIPLV